MRFVALAVSEIEGFQHIKVGHCSRDLGYALCLLIVYFYVILNFLDIQVMFRVDSFIGCQDIRENALHWFKLEVLPKTLLVYTGGGG